MKILWMDIETVPQYERLGIAPCDYVERWIQYWNARNAWKNDGRNAMDSYPTDAGLYAEFGRVCTIGVGDGDDDKWAARTMKDEHDLLYWFHQLLDERSDYWLGGHSIKDFDVPFLIRRMIIHQMILPKQLQIFNIKPWDLMIVDTNVMWGCGDWRYKITLDLLCSVLDIPSPKVETGMDGSKVRELFTARDYKTISEYCKADIHRTSCAYERLKEMESTQFS